ncbi:DUF805 domain-containing protein [Patescibacteria group bacterium]|nr:DUF805 domain-containing protein [Patescibacteria group bacterium]
MKYYLEAFKKYAVFTGRADRKQYWYFVLFDALMSYALAFVDVGISLVLGIGLENGFTILRPLYFLVSLIPGIAVGVRRMHDVNKSGWYLLIPVYNFILACTDGTPGKNDYGDDPKERVAENKPQDPEAQWNCPDCNGTNHNTTFVCSHCGYKLQ